MKKEIMKKTSEGVVSTFILRPNSIFLLIIANEIPKHTFCVPYFAAKPRNDGIRVFLVVI